MINGKRGFVFLGLVAVLTFFFGFVDESMAAKKYTLQLAGAYPSTGGTPRALATEKIKELIEAKSGGNITVNIYLDNQLGGDREILEGCQFGDISMVSQTTAPQVAFIPELAVFDIPMLFDDLDVARKTFTGPFRAELDEWYEKAGLKLLLFEPIYYRETTSSKALKKIDDFKGLKIRTMENEYHMAFWKALGANPTPLNFAELYVALQQRLVDAQENPYEVIWASKFYEVQKYLTNTNHIAFILSITMNKDIYDGMPDDYKAIIDESMKEASDFLFDLAKSKNDEMLASLEKVGMNVETPNAELKAELKKAAATVENMIRKNVGDGVVDSIIKASESAKK
ncbi:TRAP dicarboxylate transporter, DctP subunit [Dethiosulfovibrio peptidovorans DSM 11002]|uniref:TRAP dicarboxylate transporter, DctP subunit n=1 Tax=Dethiosulfovibrio peptidovorans DSM 11002 TaxID=469381 RepID=D2Z600_9BACT|nr:TRAP transporter substrate-binding protein [Dethiosulfovibrio peptidovorans]EFC90897.1 TRAP dicarboxylate transporter, DctP subunit [Dethiosulfovibrio peptidovorans DSM 11002]